MQFSVLLQQPTTDRLQHKLKLTEMTNFVDIIHRPETGTSSIYRAQQNRCLLPDDGDRLQSPKRRVSFIKDRRWIMSRKFVISTSHHRQKPSEFTETNCLSRMMVMMMIIPYRPSRIGLMIINLSLVLRFVGEFNYFALPNGLASRTRFARYVILTELFRSQLARCKLH
jgi:hypothetical protein